MTVQEKVDLFNRLCLNIVFLDVKNFLEMLKMIAQRGQRDGNGSAVAPQIICIIVVASIQSEDDFCFDELTFLFAGPKSNYELGIRNDYAVLIPNCS